MGLWAVNVGESSVYIAIEASWLRLEKQATDLSQPDRAAIETGRRSFAFLDDDSASTPVQYCRAHTENFFLCRVYCIVCIR